MKKRLGFAMCGSFCTHKDALAVMEEVSADFDVIPILSLASSTWDTRFGSAAELIRKVEEISSHPPILTVTSAERLGPAEPLDYMMICPCTGNTAAKIACGITDTPVTMAAKAHLRRNKPLLIALATNDAMSANLKNIATLIEKKNVYFVPLKQDSPLTKPHSLVADFSMCHASLSATVEKKQLRPLFLT